MRAFQDARGFHDALREVARMSVQVEDGGGTTLVNIGTLMLQKPAPAWDEDTLRTAEHELARVARSDGEADRAQGGRADARSRRALLDARRQHRRRRDAPQFVDAFSETGSGVAGRAAGASERIASDGALGFAADGADQTRDRADRRHAQRRPPALDQAFVDQISSRLAVYIGPIAPIVGERARARRRAAPNFCVAFADNLGTQERAAFLREVGLGGD
jgi:hypothetical protein